MTRIMAAEARRFANLGAALLVLALLTAAPARAHGGDLVFVGLNGQYDIRITARLSEGSVDYSVELRDAASGALVENATVQVTVQTPDGSLGPFEARPAGSVYELVRPAPEEIRWTMEVAIDGPLGQASIRHTLDLPPASIAVSAWPLIAVLLIGVAIQLYLSRRRRARVVNRAPRSTE